METLKNKTTYHEMRKKLDELEKPRIWIYYLGLVLALIPVVNIVGVLILAFVTESVRKISLLYGYYGGRIDEMLSSQTMYEEINKIAYGKND